MLLTEWEKVFTDHTSDKGLLSKIHGIFMQLTRKDSDAGRDWGQEEKGTTEDEMAGGRH